MVGQRKLLYTGVDVERIRGHVSNHGWRQGLVTMEAINDVSGPIYVIKIAELESTLYGCVERLKTYLIESQNIKRRMVSVGIAEERATLPEINIESSIKR